MENPLILVIDDSQTIRKMVECHLSQAGYRVVMAADAERGLELAASLRPDLILLDHQLPGTTGDEVCRRLLEAEETAQDPRRHQLGHAEPGLRQLHRVRQRRRPDPQAVHARAAQERRGQCPPDRGAWSSRPSGPAAPCRRPSARSMTRLSRGPPASFPLRAVLDFLNNAQQSGRLTLETGNDRIRFALAAGRVQAVYSPTIGPDRLADSIPDDLADLAPLLGLDPRRAAGRLDVRAGQAAGAKPLRPAPAPCPAPVPGGRAHLPGRDRRARDVRLRADHRPSARCSRRSRSSSARRPWSSREAAGARPAARSRRMGQAGLRAADRPWGHRPTGRGCRIPEIKIHTLLDGSHCARRHRPPGGLEPRVDVAVTVRGLELAGLVERRTPSSTQAILALDDDPETVRLLQRVLGPEGTNHQIKIVRDRVAAQLLLRRQAFNLVILALDRPDQEAFFQDAASNRTRRAARFIGIASIEDETELARLDAMGLDGVLHRPVSESDLLATVKHLLTQDRRQIACAG